VRAGASTETVFGSLLPPSGHIGIRKDRRIGIEAKGPPRKNICSRSGSSRKLNPVGKAATRAATPGASRTLSRSARGGEKGKGSEWRNWYLWPLKSEYRHPDRGSRERASRRRSVGSRVHQHTPHRKRCAGRSAGARTCRKKLRQASGTEPARAMRSPLDACSKRGQG